MTKSQKLAGEMIIEAVDNGEAEKIGEKLDEFFRKNPQADREEFLSGVKIGAAYGPWTDFGEEPILWLMETGWQDGIKDEIIDRLYDSDEAFEEELMDADLEHGGSFRSEDFGFSVDIEPTDALSLLKDMEIAEKSAPKNAGPFAPKA